MEIERRTMKKLKTTSVLMATGCLLWGGLAWAEAPWREAGLTEKQAAAHALDRLGFGARPGEVDRVVAMGVDRWIEEQLRATQPESTLDGKLKSFKTLDLSARKMAETFPNRAAVLRQAVQAGVIENPERSRDGSMAEMERLDPRPANMSREQRQKVRRWARSQGFLPQQRAFKELTGQKVLRARYAENQLQEVLADFWFNHFNVSVTDTRARIYVWPYERDAIRPFVLGRFGDMLEATAKHPAMLHYLDNAGSVADGEHGTTLDHRLDNAGRQGRRLKARMEKQRRRMNAPSGLNENYARELMELHTLGVDGGYDQDDVIAVARAFTGWTALPPSGMRPEMQRRLSRARQYPQAGFVVDDESGFVFRADAHDAGEKTVLGHRLAAGRGLEDGLQVLEILVAHPSTARHLAGKLAARFVSDDPPPALVDRLAKVFTRTGGDLGAMMTTLVESPEFWDPAARAAKIKSPFELVISSLRAVDADLVSTGPIVKWIERLGQPLYAYQAPTGYPDRAEAWVNTGALLNRMNFGLQFATSRIAGVPFDLLALNGGREPASLEDALRIYVPILLPERDSEKTFARLRPMIRNPELARRIEESMAPPDDIFDMTGADTDEWEAFAEKSVDRRIRRPAPSTEGLQQNALAHVVGVILGSPEFQRR